VEAASPHGGRGYEGPDLAGGTVTFLLADVDGSAAPWEATPGSSFPGRDGQVLRGRSGSPAIDPSSEGEYAG